MKDILWEGPTLALVPLPGSRQSQGWLQQGRNFLWQATAAGSVSHLFVSMVLQKYIVYQAVPEPWLMTQRSTSPLGCQCCSSEFLPLPWCVLTTHVRKIVALEAQHSCDKRR